MAVVVPANNSLKQYHLQHWHEILQETPGYSLMQHANQLIPQHGNRLLQVGFENAVFFYNGIVIGDWFGPGRYRQMMQCTHTPREPERGSKIDLPAYQLDFTLQQLTPDGVLLTLK